VLALLTLAYYNTPLVITGLNMTAIHVDVNNNTATK